jgi:hypothetical protein
MDVGWVAHLDSSGPTALALRIDSKSLGPKGLSRTGVEEFVWEAFSGKRKRLPVPVMGAVPVDIDGDGFHELARRGSGSESELIDGHGKILAAFAGTVVCASKLLPLAGEQVISYTAGGAVRIWADENARDSDRARQRYAHPYYRTNQRLTATGSNLINLGGL